MSVGLSIINLEVLSRTVRCSRCDVAMPENTKGYVKVDISCWLLWALCLECGDRVLFKTIAWG